MNALNKTYAWRRNFDLEERPAPPPPPPSVGVIGGDDGPTALWIPASQTPSSSQNGTDFAAKRSRSPQSSLTATRS